MPAVPSRSRVLLTAADSARPTLAALVPTDDWETAEAATIEEARFRLEAQAQDVVVVDGGLAGTTWADAVRWLAGLTAAPLVVVSPPAEGVVLPALRVGALWLPTDLARRQPALFAGVLHQAAWVGRERLQAGLTDERLTECRRHVDRLLDLLWEAAPGITPSHWYSQRHMLERLEEEVERSKRNGSPLSLVLGKVQPATPAATNAERTSRVAAWTVTQLTRHKRRADVVGRYGLDGFLLLLPQAEAAQAVGAARRLRRVLSDPPHDLPAVHACFGLASVPVDAASVPGLLRRAEDRLEQAADTADGVVCP
ncbi:MAG: diguanylate cyclase [Gemmataceae bacterium]